jgi:UDP-N-acetyl-D-glucosamine dehydrogenase
MNIKAELEQKIRDKTLKVAVVGLGYVGLPLAVEKAKAGYRTIGFDIQSEKVSKLNSGINYIGDVVDADLASLVASGRLTATTDFSFIQDVDFVAICVPTPLDAHRAPDISYVRNSTIEIAKYLKRGMIVVLESTTYPGTTEELILPILEGGSGLVCGEDFYLAFSPERVDPGNLLYSTKNTPKIVGGVGAEATEITAAVYESVLEGAIHKVSSPKVAEMEKLLENTYRNINIGLVNELAMICERMEISVWDVIEAAKTKPYGFQAFYPGVGVGGHCIPLDPFYLSWKAREYDYHTQLIETAAVINDRMPAYVTERCARILNRVGKSFSGSELLILGVAYKQDIADYRESPALKLIELLEEQGARVRYYDPYIPEYHYKGSPKTGEVALTKELLQSADLIVIAVAHTKIDYDFVCTHARFVFDTKNATKAFRSSGNRELL